MANKPYTRSLRVKSIMDFTLGSYTTNKSREILKKDLKLISRSAILLKLSTRVNRQAIKNLEESKKEIDMVHRICYSNIAVTERGRRDITGSKLQTTLKKVEKELDKNDCRLYNKKAL